MNRRLAEILMACIILSGLAGIVATISLRGREADIVLVTLAVITFLLGCSALARPGWPRVPIALVCVVAVLIGSIPASNSDDTMAPTGFGYVLLNVAVIALAGLALLVTIRQDQRAKDRSNRHLNDV